MRANRLIILVTVIWAVSPFPEGSSWAGMRQRGQTVWDGVYTRTQSARGRVLFQSECIRCHEVSDFVGEDYMATWEGQTLKEFYLYISSGMPPDLHEEVTDFQAYADLLAYVLQSNDFPAGETDLSADLDRLNRVRIEAPR